MSLPGADELFRTTGGMALQPSNLTAIDFIEAGRVEPLAVVITRRGGKEVA